VRFFAEVQAVRKGEAFPGGDAAVEGELADGGEALGLLEEGVEKDEAGGHGFVDDGGGVAKGVNFGVKGGEVFGAGEEVVQHVG
jgi:hypothetical protein